MAEYLLIPRERPPRGSSIRSNSTVVPGELPVVLPLLDKIIKLDDIRILSDQIGGEVSSNRLIKLREHDATSLEATTHLLAKLI